MPGLELALLYLIGGEIVTLAMIADKDFMAIVQNSRLASRWVVYAAVAVIVMGWPAVLLWLLTGQHNSDDSY